MRKFAVIMMLLSFLVALAILGRDYSQSKQDPNYRITISETKFDSALNILSSTSKSFLCQDWNLVVDTVYYSSSKSKKRGSLPYAHIRQATMVISWISLDSSSLTTRKSSRNTIVQLEKEGVSVELFVEDLHTSKPIFHYKSGQTSILK